MQLHLTEWDHRYFDLAELVGSWSKDTTKVGAVAVGKYGQILSQGYNGFPRGVVDDPDRYGDREEKLKFIVHAEHNCVYNACLNGASLEGATLYVQGVPTCNECAKGIIQSGIKTVFSRYPSKFDVADHANPWVKATQITRTMFRESGVKLNEFISN